MLNQFLKKENSNQSRLEDTHSLNEWEPLSSLPIRHQEEILSRSYTERLQAGETLFKINDTEEKDYYLLTGSIHLRDARNVRVGEIKATGNKKLQLIDHHHPRIYKAIVAEDAEIFVTRRTFFDTLNAQADLEAPELEVDEIDLEASGNWMLQMLNSGTFAHLDPSRMEEVFVNMTSLEVSAGQTLFEEGDEHSDFYLIQDGQATILAGDQPISLLNAGDTFGEQSIITYEPCRYSVRMETDGHLMRMTSSGFQSLIANSLIKVAPENDISQLTEDGACILDLRNGSSRLKTDQVKLSIMDLYSQWSALDTQKQYLVLADTSEVARLGSYLLASRGFDVTYGSETLLSTINKETFSEEELVKTQPIENVNSQNDVEPPLLSKEQAIPTESDEHDLVQTMSDHMKDLELMLRKEMNDLMVLKQRELEREMAIKFQQYHLITAKLMKKKLAELDKTTSE